MIKHDALRRALGAAWVVMFLSTLLLPVGSGLGAARPALADDDGVSPAPFVDAQGVLAPSVANQIDASEPSAAEPPPAPASQPEARPAEAPPSAPVEQQVRAKIKLRR